ncbi:MAG: TetR/AcrR family transcriptional regulator [Acidimicrobiales bacterium]
MALGEAQRTAKAAKTADGMTGRRDRRAERREATKAEILEHAWQLALEEGLAGISLSELAKRVGMRAPSLYSYFDSKHAIYDAMFAQGFQQLAEARVADDPVRTRADFIDSAKRFVEFCTTNTARYHLLFQRTIPGFEPSPESYATSVTVLERTRAALSAVGATSPEALDVYTAIMTGLTDQQISNDPGGDRWSRLVDEVIGMFLDRYATAAAPAAQKKGGRQ